VTIARASPALIAALAVALWHPFQANAYDAEAGRKKAEETCAGCHGPDGNSETPEVPALAGQQSRYIILALFQFRAGHRKSEQMAPFADGLTDEDLGNLAAYYSAQKPALPTETMEPQKAAAARRLADDDHCTQCHGADLLGQEHIPRLAGQHYQYLKQQLLEFKAGTRGDIDGNMTSAAQPLSDADIDTLARYAASLSTPGSQP
jgi:cytochrome c553